MYALSWATGAENSFRINKVYLMSHLLYKIYIIYAFILSTIIWDIAVNKTPALIGLVLVI